MWECPKTFRPYRLVIIFLGDRADILNEECKKKITKGLDIFSDTVQQLMSGDITIDTVFLLDQHRATMMKIQEVLDQSQQSTTEDPKSKIISGSLILLKVLEWRKLEVEAYRKMRTIAQRFSQMCSSFKPGTSAKLIL